MDNTILTLDMEDIYSRKIDWKQLDGKTILLTGAYGMLASYIVYLLLSFMSSLWYCKPFSIHLMFIHCYCVLDVEVLRLER